MKINEIRLTLFQFPRGLCQSSKEDEITFHPHHCVLWFPRAGQEKKYEVKKSRVLRGKSVPHYAAVVPQGKGLMVASEKPFAFTHVDGHPVERQQPEPMEVEKTGGLEGLLEKQSYAMQKSNALI